MLWLSIEIVARVVILVGGANLVDGTVPPGGAGIRFRAYISNYQNQGAKTPYISN